MTKREGGIQTWNTRVLITMLSTILKYFVCILIFGTYRSVSVRFSLILCKFEIEPKKKNQFFKNLNRNRPKQSKYWIWFGWFRSVHLVCQFFFFFFPALTLAHAWRHVNSLTSSRTNQRGILSKWFVNNGNDLSLGATYLYKHFDVQCPC